jgi:hypothetical protein
MRLKKEKGRSHQVRIRRTFTDEFKRQIAEAVIMNSGLNPAIFKKDGLSNRKIARWLPLVDTFRTFYFEEICILRDKIMTIKENFYLA